MGCCACSYRINEDVYIGLRVRKSPGKGVLPFKNIPFKDSVISSFQQNGIYLSHKSFPKDAWIDFRQIPLLKLTIENGIIKDELTFVESIVGGSTTDMYLTKTDTDEYRQYVKDKEEKDNREILKPKDLKPGWIVSSAMCPDSSEMIFLGNFYQYFLAYGYLQDGRYNSSEGRMKLENVIYYNKKGLERLVFLSPNGDGTFKVSIYPKNNKVVKEMYYLGGQDERYTNLESNRKFISEYFTTSEYDNMPDFFVFYNFFKKSSDNFKLPERKHIKRERYSGSSNWTAADGAIYWTSKYSSVEKENVIEILKELDTYKPEMENFNYLFDTEDEKYDDYYYSSNPFTYYWKEAYFDRYDKNLTYTIFRHRITRKQIELPITKGEKE